MTVGAALMLAVGGTAQAGATTVLWIHDGELVEGNSGTAKMKFRVTKTHAKKAVTVHYKTDDSTATAPADYTAKSGKLSFSSQRGLRVIKVPVIGEAVAEPDEVFSVKLSDPTRARIVRAKAEGAILDDDSPPGCFGDAAPASEGANPGDLAANACGSGAGGDAQPTCGLSGNHQWWSFQVPAGETATFSVLPTDPDDLGVALFTADSAASELDCADGFGPGSEETASTTNAGITPLTVYVQIFAAAGDEGAYTLTIDSQDGCFNDAAAAIEGDNLGDLSANACPPGFGTDAEPTCEMDGDHQWWSFEIPAGEAASFTVLPTNPDDMGIALYTGSSAASQVDCKDNFGPGGAETATAGKSGGVSPLTVYIQVFALAGDEGPYKLTIASSP